MQLLTFHTLDGRLISVMMHHVIVFMQDDNDLLSLRVSDGTIIRTTMPFADFQAQQRPATSNIVVPVPR